MADPTTIAGLVARWKASSLALSDGDPVSSWSNTGSSALAATQGTASKRPLYKTNIFGTKPAVLFDGVDDVLLTSGVVTADTDYTMVVVLKDPAGYSVYGTHLMNGGVGYGLLWNTGGKRQIYHRGHAVLDDGTYTANTAEVWTATRTAAPVASLYVNGTSQSITNSTATVNTPATNTWIGADSNGTTGQNFSRAYIAEILIYDSALGATDRATVHTYVQDEYGITVSDYAGGGGPAPFVGWGIPL